MKILHKILFAILSLGIALPLLLSAIILVAAGTLVYDIIATTLAVIAAVVLYIIK